MLRPMNQAPVTIVGPGRLGAVLASELVRAEFPLREIVSRKAPSSLRKARLLARRLKCNAVTVGDARFDAQVIWLCMPDRQIRPLAQKLAPTKDWAGKIIFHSSGALSSDELDAFRKQGAAVASVHPLMTFVYVSEPRLSGVPFAIEGDPAAIRVARQIVRGLRGEPFRIRKQDKAAYHAWGTLASPLLIALLIAMEETAVASGVAARDARKKLLPIVNQTLRNYAGLGPAKAFSGPLVRGETAVVRKHLAALKKIPHVRNVYRALAQIALRHLPVKNRKELKLLLTNP
jgi:predicted short-subunit dehydrogenase-like oxidoreductase (DUF2520 family)